MRPEVILRHVSARQPRKPAAVLILEHREALGVLRTGWISK